MSEREQLEQAIAAQEGLRATLGDAIVDATIAALRQQLAALQPAPVAEQRKLVTVLFSDLVGFTPMSEKMDPEQVREVLDLYFRPWKEAIARHGGVVEKFIGDAVMAVFGIPTASEQDAENAIRAALEVRDGLDDLNSKIEQQYGVRLSMRTGIHSGPVLVGAIGRDGDFTVTGDTVNLASRLQGAAPVNGILVSHDTYRLVRGVFDVVAQPLLTVKGKSEPIQTYVVERARPRAFRMVTRGLEGVETRMVDREAGLVALQDTYHDVVEGPEARVVTIVGDAGVGKTRLLVEFESWLETRPETIHFFRGRASLDTQAVPYSLIRDMLANRFDIRETDGPAVALAKFRAGMRLVEAQEADLIGHMVGFDFSVSPAVQKLRGSSSFGELGKAYLVNYLSALATPPPGTAEGVAVAILFEDVHWADDASLDVIDHLVAEIPAHRLLIVCLARPLLFERRPNWGEGRGAYVTLLLPPLSLRHSRALVGELLQRVDEVPAALRDLLLDSAEGNPYYMEELVRMLIEDGVIVVGEGAWRVEAARLAAVRVPSTLAGVLQARIDSLPQENRMVLQCAAVVGRVFWDTAVSRLLGAAQIDVPACLEALRQRGMVLRRERSAFEGTQEFVFQNTVLRDVTYESVLLRQRRDYHGRVAAWLEENVGERAGEYLGLIARHYELAGEADKAVGYYQRAGEDAAEMRLHREAAQTFERALALLPADAPQRAVLLVGLGAAQRELAQCDAAEQSLREGLTLARAAGDMRMEVAALYNLGGVELERENIATARDLYQQSLDKARAIDDSKGAANALLALGIVAFIKQHLDEAEGYFIQALAAFRQCGDQMNTLDALSHVAAVLQLQERYDEAERYSREALGLLDQIDDPRKRADSLIFLNYVCRMRGDFEQAVAYCQESLALARRIGYRAGIANALDKLAAVLSPLGRHEEAERHLEEQVGIYRALGNTPLLAQSLIDLGLAALRQGKHQVALSRLEEGLALNREIGALWNIADNLAQLGYCHAEAGEPEAARGNLREALAIALPLADNSYLLTRILVSAMHLLIRAGRSEQAAELFGVVSKHPSAKARNFQVMHLTPLLARLTEALPAAELEAALERGRGAEIEQAAQALLAEFE